MRFLHFPVADAPQSNHSRRNGQRCRLLGYTALALVALREVSADPGLPLASGLNPLLSAHGDRIVYQRQVSGILQLHVLDVASGVTRRITRSAADGPSYGAHLVNQGQTLLFESQANELVDADTNQLSDVFLTDLSTGTTRCLSLRADGLMSEAPAGRPSASADGRFIAWESESRGQVALPADSLDLPDLFLFDQIANTTVMVNTNRWGRNPAGVSSLLTLSTNGRRTLFRCTTNDITAPAVAGTASNWYWRDNTTGDQHMLRLNPNGPVVHVPLNCFGLSGDGRYVGATVLGAGVTTNAVYRIDLETGAYIQGPRIGAVILPAGANAIRFDAVDRMDLNRDGSRALISGVYRPIGGAIPARRGVVLWEPDAQKSRAIELAGPLGAIPTGFLHSAELSPDETRLAVVNSKLGLLVIDLQGNVQFGPIATGDFPAPSFSQDGRWLAFQISRGSPSTAPWPADSLFLVDLSIVTRPKITIGRNDSGLVIAWDRALVEFNLETSDGVNGWQRMDPSESGRLILPPNAPVQFFRLRRP